MKAECKDESCMCYGYEHDHLPDNMIKFGFPGEIPRQDATYTIEQLKDIEKKLKNKAKKIRRLTRGKS